MSAGSRQHRASAGAESLLVRRAMSLPKLVYFRSRGRAEVIRLALAEAQVAYEEENFVDAEFPALKASGRLPFLAVPVWEENGETLAQSAAILNHIGRAHGLRGKSARDEAKIDEALGAVEDVRIELRKLMHAEPAKRADLRAQLLQTTLPRWFALLEKLLAANHGGQGFIAADAFSVADCALWYLLEMSVDNGFGAALADCPKLQAFSKRIAARPNIAAYLASPRRHAFIPLPK